MSNVLARCGRCGIRFQAAATGRPRRFCSDACRVGAWRRTQKRRIHFSSATDEWSTPPDLFAELHAEFGFDLDVCATPSNAKCSHYFTRDDDGLAQEWRGNVWLNPPYGRTIGSWIAKAHESADTGAVVVCLVPARTDTRWWHDHVAQAAEVRFIKGRVKFGNATTGAPFPSAIVVFRNARV